VVQKSVAFSPNMKKMPSISDFYKPKHRQVIHLNNAQNYNRLAVYKKLDFNKFIASSGTKDKPSSTELYGPYPSDKTTYQNVLTELNSDKGQFIYALTMQNHGPYGSPHKPYDIWGDNFSDAENNALQDYADRLLETDRVTEEFLNTLKTIDKEITVVFYGDHLPGLYPTNFFQTDDLQKQTTDYFIWSNKKNVKHNYPLIRSNDLPAMLLETTNSKLSPYFALLTKTLPSEQEGINKERAKDLALIQYDLTVGNYYLKNYPQFFDISH
ncbi:sulfatase-like hydrolase/transferase, partial [Streptococcus iniae]